MPDARPIKQAPPDPVRILLIEAGEECAERVFRALECMDWACARIDSAANLREALARLRLEKFDLVLTALELPDSSGLATLDEVARAFERLIIVLTAGEDPALRERVIAHGAFEILPKGRVDAAALERLLRLAASQEGSVREARFRKTFELAGSGIAHLDLEGRFLRVNRKLCDILGYAESALVGRALSELAHPAVQASAALVRDPAGNPHYEICVVEDITEGKEIETRQAADARYPEAIARFAQSALVRREANELVAEAVGTAQRALGGGEVSYVESGEAALPGMLRADAGGICGEAAAFLDTMASLLCTGLQRIDSQGKPAFLARFDPLTGLPNRAVLTERLSRMIEQAKLRAAPLALLVVELAGGDELSKETALRLLGAVRNGDIVARVGADQFAVVLAELARAEDTALVAQKILDRLPTASVGIATCPGDGDGAEALISSAAAAMYRARRSGRNGYEFFSSAIPRRTRARGGLGLELRRALERNEFGLVYQPKIDLRSGRPCGAEALLRWHHPRRGLMSPSQFLPVLEETGLIVPVGEWVIGRACEDIKAWRAAGLEVLPVAVNLSARQFRQPRLERRIRSLVQGAGVDPALIELEITESQLMEDPAHAVRVMSALRESGIRAAIDDFGTGYSSLACLTRLPLAALKIDRSFVADALTYAADAAIVRTIIDMARTLDFTVVAEGVETDGQAAFLRHFGCEQGQGFLFARPMSATDFTALI